MSIIAVDGAVVRGSLALRADVVIVGSGPGGAAVARTLARAGVDVVVVEEGRYHYPDELTDDPLAALFALYRGKGAVRTAGRRPMSVLQGVALGGTSVVNSGICWRLPEDVHCEWVWSDPALAGSLPFESLERIAAGLEHDLAIGPTPDAIAGESARRMAVGADAFGLAHRPTHRNVRDCLGLGRCNLGCPAGAKLSMERSFLPDAVAHGARIVTSARVVGIDVRRGTARGVEATTIGGGSIHLTADRAVILSAGAIHTPTLLLSNGIDDGPVGRRLQCHPGLVVVGRFREPVHSWRGATQGHEVTGLRSERLKLETLALSPALLAARLNRVGTALTDAVDELCHWAAWDAAIRAEAMGRVRCGRRGPRITYTMTANDVRRAGRAVRWLGSLMFAAGASEVVPGVAAWDSTVTDPSRLDALETDARHAASGYSFTISHLFGTCALGTDPATSVVAPDLAHHRVQRLVVADASVFPTNTGVNPQLSIMTLAVHAAEAILGGATPLPASRPVTIRR